MPRGSRAARERRTKWSRQPRFGMFVHWGLYAIPARGESIYGSQRCPFGGGMIGMTTCKGRTAYLHVFRWPGEEACISGIKNKVKSARLLATKRKARIVQKGDRLFLRGLPKNPPDRHDTVIALELVGKPQGC